MHKSPFAFPPPAAKRSELLRVLARAAPREQLIAAKNDQICRLGAQIRTLRLAAHRTAGDVARTSGVSRSMLSRVERGQVSPSVETLNRIARAIDVPVSRFFSDQPSRNDMSLVRAGQGIVVDRSGAAADYRYELLGHVLSGNLSIEPYRVTLMEGAKPYVSFQHPGMKFLQFTHGTALYRYGNRVMEIRQGDSLLFDASVLHGIEEVLCSPIDYLVVVLTMRE